jgi:hypothetical protein
MSNPVADALAAARWSEYVEREARLAEEYVPGRDRKKRAAFRLRAAARLREIFTPDELANLAAGKASLSIHDHRIQRLIFDSVRLADMDAAPRSWSPDEQAKFGELLPPEIRQIIGFRDQQRETEMRRAQNRAADAERELKLLKEKPDGNIESQTAA